MITEKDDYLEFSVDLKELFAAIRLLRYIKELLEKDGSKEAVQLLAVAIEALKFAFGEYLPDDGEVGADG